VIVRTDKAINVKLSVHEMLWYHSSEGQPHAISLLYKYSVSIPDRERH